MVPIDFKQNFGSVLVIDNGSGSSTLSSLGRIVVDELIDSYHCRVSMLDLNVSRDWWMGANGIQYFSVDVSLLGDILPVFQQLKPSVVIYTVSASEGSESANIERIRAVIKACTETGVKGLVYSSTASVSACW
jgi:sterol-4alpha-carboxylate 3-dehydrogenase (decarboxylating)